MLASLATRAIPLVARVLPTILSGLTTGLYSGGINKAISGSGAVGDGLYLHKHNKCYRVQKCNGNSLYLAPHPRFVEGDGLFLKYGNDISDGASLLMGKNSPFKNIPVLGWLLWLFRRDVYKTKYSVFLLSVWYSQSCSMDNIFGDSIANGPGNQQVVKKVVATEGTFKDYGDEIQQSYELGFTPYRLHKNTDGTFVTPIRYYDAYMYWKMLLQWRLVLQKIQ